MTVASLPLTYSNWYVGVSHCRQIRYSGSSMAREFYYCAAAALCTVAAIIGSMNFASFVEFSMTEP